MKKFRQFVNESEKNPERILSDKFIWVLKHIDNNISNLILEHDFSKRYYLIDIDYYSTYNNIFLILCESRSGQIYNITIGKFINDNIINVPNKEMEDFIDKYKKQCVEYICEKEPYNAYEYIEYLTPEQKEKYKEFITLDRDFDIFESVDYKFDDYFNQIEDGDFEELTDDLWDALTAEEWTNEEDRDDFLGDREKDDFKYIELKISKTDRFGLASMDDSINKKFMNFRTKLKEKYNLEYLDIIDYKEGNVYIIKK